MQLSAFSVVDAFPPHLAAGRDRYSELLDLGTTCEEAGLSALWVAEHHFHPGGLCPSPPVLLAALGQRTHTLRLGVLVSVLPFHAPVELAEQYAMVDRLLGGRLNLGLGSGYIPMEFQGFGVDPATKRERFDRAFEALLAALRGDPVTPTLPGGSAIRLNVAPVQIPHPPLWIGVQRREAIPFVARKRTNLALVPYATLQDLSELAQEVQEYRSALPDGVRGRVSVALHLYAGGEPNRAREALQRYLASRLETQSSFFQEKVRLDPRQASAEAVEASGFALFGTARDVAERLRRFEAAGVDEVLGIFDFGGLPSEGVRASVRDLALALRKS